MTPKELLAAGLIDLRNSYYYKETRRRYPTTFATTLLGKAEAKFMSANPTRQSVDDGLGYLRSSWAYLKTKSINSLMFGSTLMGKAEKKFVQARDLLPNPFLGISIFAEPGYFTINISGVEEYATYVQAGFKWGALNVGDYQQEEWNTIRAGMQAVGLVAVPWRRCYTSDVSKELCAVAKAWNSPVAIHNVESEAISTNPPEALIQVVDANQDLRHAVMTEPWVQNLYDMQNVSRWKPLGDRSVVCIPETYLNVDPRWEPSVCIQHAKDMGFQYAVPGFGWGIWSDAPYDVSPETYLSKYAGNAWCMYHMITTDQSSILRWKR